MSRVANIIRHTLLAASFCLSTGMAHAETLTIYSARTEELLKPILDAYQKETGVNIRVVNNREAVLLDQLKAEGRRTRADMLITVDAGNLWLASEAGVLRPIRSKALQKAIPANLRDPSNHWFGLGIRARTVFFNTDKLKANDIISYEDLADPRWKGRLCLRTSKKVYNQSLVAMLIAEHGEAKTESIVRGWVNNLATPPFSDDTRLLEAIAAGQCEVGIANTYYFGRYKASQPNAKVDIAWPNQKTDGVHINISGAGVTRHAKNPATAQRFLEWMASEKGQSLFADINMEYPANPNVKPAELVSAWGPFKASSLNVSQAGKLQRRATQLMDRVGYR